MQTVLTVIQIMITLALVGIVLIQRSEGGGLGIGGGSGFMSARGTANALTRTTAILAALFFVTTLGQGIMARYSAKPTDILDKIPLTESGQQNGILDALGGSKPAETKPAPADNGVPSEGAAAPASTAPAATTSAPVAETPAPAATAPAAAPTDNNAVPQSQ